VPKVRESSPYQLYNEDCFQTFARIPSASVDMVLCDPPYGTTACSWDSVIPLPEMWRELARIIKPVNAICLMSTEPFTSALITSNLALFKYRMTWLKTKVNGVVNAKLRPLKVTEDVCVFSKGATANGSDRNMVYNPQGLKKLNQSVAKQQKASGATGYFRENQPDFHFQEWTNYPKDLIDIPSEGLMNGHPTEKPVKLMDYLIRTYTNEGDTVLDFAMGSGTTGVAAMHLGRKFIGCDSDKENGYFDTAELRIKTAWRQAQQKRPGV
jgi:site-specific DNA-methyltransferase (adenine-specific)